MAERLDPDLRTYSKKDLESEVLRLRALIDAELEKNFQLSQQIIEEAKRILNNG